jgi:hypothetical protein
MFIENMNKIEIPDPSGVVHSPCNLVLNSSPRRKNLIPGAVIFHSTPPGSESNLKSPFL